jgi:hypothetical protein
MSGPKPCEAGLSWGGIAPPELRGGGVWLRIAQ